MPLDFSLSREQEEIRQLAHEFAEKEIRPKAAEYDEHQTHPADVIAKAHEVGLMNPHMPEELGGAGLGALEGALIGEELCWGCSGIGTSIIANILGALPVLLAGTEEQQREWLAPLLEEPILCSFGLTEPNAGSDVSGIQTTAVRMGDDYVINGSKMFITNAGQAAWLTVFASTDKDAGHRGLTAFVVPTDADGVTIEKHLDKMGQRATLQSSYAKRFAADTAMKVTTDAVQVFGGYGYIKEFPVEKLMRDAKLFQIYEGTSQIQRLVIAREIFLPRD